MKVTTVAAALTVFASIPAFANYQIYWTIMDSNQLSKATFNKSDARTVTRDLKTLLGQLECSRSHIIQDFDGNTVGFDVIATCSRQYTFGLSGISPLTALGSPTYSINGNHHFKIRDGRAVYSRDGVQVTPDNIR